MKKLAVLLILSIFCIIITVVNCYAIVVVQNYTIDNDTIDPNFSNMKKDFGWISSNNSFNQDAEIHTIQLPDTRDYYGWVFPTYSRYTEIKAQVRVYLYYGAFTDPCARYELNNLNSLFATSFDLNQNTAPAGWNVFQDLILPFHDSTGFYSTHYLRVFPSDSKASTYPTTYYCGADAVQIKLGY